MMDNLIEKRGVKVDAVITDTPYSIIANDRIKITDEKVIETLVNKGE